MKPFWLPLLASSLLWPAVAVAQTDTALAILQAKQPAVEWQAASAMRMDVICDGKPDQALLGYGRDRTVWLGVVAAGRATPLLLRFRLGGEGQDAFCASPVRLTAGPLHCSDEDAGTLPGCRERPGCATLVLDDEQCDAIRVYGDSTHKKLRWWRR